MDGSAFSVRDGRLYVEELACTELAARFGTPLYVMSETRLRSNVRRLGTALAAGWPLGSARLLPSIKANPTLATRAVLTSEGAGCDTFGETELEMALQAGVPAALISVNGASKSAALIRHAVAAGARITLDSERELPIAEKAAADAGTTARVRIRLRPRLDGVDAPSDFASDGTSIREVFQTYKAGVPIDDAAALGRAALDSRHIDLVGVHAHLARQPADVSVWRAQIASFAGLLAEMSARWDGWLPAEIHDRGLAREGMLLDAEPGRAVYADAGLHLATVTNVKRQRDPDRRCWIETDTSEVFLLDTTLEHALFPVVSATRGDAGPAFLADITGISCNFDVIAPAVEVPDLQPGEVLAFLETGAYQDASAANFNGLPRPATVLVCGTTAEVVKRRETIEDVLGRDSVPVRLQAGVPAGSAA